MKTVENNNVVKVVENETIKVHNNGKVGPNGRRVLRVTYQEKDITSGKFAEAFNAIKKLQERLGDKFHDSVVHGSTEVVIDLYFKKGYEPVEDLASIMGCFH